MVAGTFHGGDADVARAAALFADPTRAQVLLALADGRSLPASVLAAEAGVSPQAASTQLGALRTGGLVTVEQSGRHRYYRLATDRVAAVLEALAAVAPAQPVRSLRQGTRAAALRRARTCYDHLAGALGCAVTEGLLERGVLESVDGVADTRRRPGDPISAALRVHPYRIGPGAADVLAPLGIDVDELVASRGGRPLLRFCLDWSEQRHHLAGLLGARLLDAFTGAGWIVRRPRRRDVLLIEEGAHQLQARLGVTVETAASA